MCNACGFYCCAYDGFSGCGCDGCPVEACWSDDEDEWGDDDDYYDPSRDMKASSRRPKLRCEAVSP